MIDTNEKTLIGYSSEGEEKLHSVKEVAEFICKYGKNEDVAVYNQDGDFVLDTFGIFINRIMDMDYRENLLKVLVPMQLEVEREAFGSSDDEDNDEDIGMDGM